MNIGTCTHCNVQMDEFGPRMESLPRCCFDCLLKKTPSTSTLPKTFVKNYILQTVDLAERPGSEESEESGRDGGFMFGQAVFGNTGSAESGRVGQLSVELVRTETESDDDESTYSTIYSSEPRVPSFDRFLDVFLSSETTQSGMFERYAFVIRMAKIAWEEEEGGFTQNFINSLCRHFRKFMLNSPPRSSVLAFEDTAEMLKEILTPPVYKKFWRDVFLLSTRDFYNEYPL